ncbi:MAG: hypothetical protein NTV15_08750 [Candidatus Bathyarchaeota archaeon]|nr:hypothetical protein [Candidatus Bathyarchaeota archaeon]
MGTTGEARKLLKRLETHEYEMEIPFTPELISRLDDLNDLYARARTRNQHKRKPELPDSKPLLNET